MTKEDLKSWVHDPATRYYIDKLQEAAQTTTERLINIDHTSPESLPTHYAYQKGFLDALRHSVEVIRELLTDGESEDDEEI
jgi:hypothetical protein